MKFSSFRKCSRLVALALAVGCCLVTRVQAQTAKFLGEDRVAQGSWRNLYGKDGYYLPYTAVSLPSYASIGVTGQYDHVWAGNTADPRALERVGESHRTAACWHNLTFDINLTFPDSQPHRVSLYCLDWDPTGRAQIIEIRDAATNALLDSRAIANFQGGSYLRWNISGSVRIVVINNAPGLNAVISGVFFDPTTTEPAWWTQGPTPVINPSALPDNKAVPNIGQAKWIAKNALAALRGIDGPTADLVEADLLGPGKIILDWDAPADPAEQAAQHAPLLIGQLKAISAPFYNHLHQADALWLAGQCTLNGTSHVGSYFPWTLTISDDTNKAAANIGQLKAVFSLRFESFMVDVDQDGLVDGWEILHFGSIEAHDGNTDADLDGLSNAWEHAYGLDPSNGTGINGPDGDLDGDGVVNKADARPNDVGIGEAVISITLPANGATIN